MATLEIARAYLDAVAARDYDRIRSLMADDFRLRDLSPPGFTQFIGRDAVRACLAALTSRPTAHDWRWVDRQISVVGNVAWLIADAPWQTVHPDGGVTERPYRVTGVFVHGEGGWRWSQYHGSEPLGSVG
ncbi:MAG: nuclear transport factor 2 family protein [Thermoleophilia bacterium]|nr:nuclear transport factor 2 family protein [Thermoleophilia bacterium]